MKPMTQFEKKLLEAFKELSERLSEIDVTLTEIESHLEKGLVVKK